MTDDALPGRPELVEPELVEEVNAIPDPILTAMVQVINQSDANKIGLTLQVCGSTITGTAISASAFFDQMAQWVAERGARDFGESFAKPMAATLREEQAAPEDEQSIPRFIHLRDAAVYAPGAAQSIPQPLWRGRLSHVSGWSIGSLSYAS